MLQWPSRDVIRVDRSGELSRPSSAGNVGDSCGPGCADRVRRAHRPSPAASCASEDRRAWSRVPSTGLASTNRLGVVDASRRSVTCAALVGDLIDPDPLQASSTLTHPAASVGRHPRDDRCDRAPTAIRISSVTALFDHCVANRPPAGRTRECRPAPAGPRELLTSARGLARLIRGASASMDDLGGSHNEPTPPPPPPTTLIQEAFDHRFRIDPDSLVAASRRPREPVPHRAHSTSSPSCSLRTTSRAKAGFRTPFSARQCLTFDKPET